MCILTKAYLWDAWPGFGIPAGRWGDPYGERVKGNAGRMQCLGHQGRELQSLLTGCRPDAKENGVEFGSSLSPVTGRNLALQDSRADLPLLVGSTSL